MELEKLLQQAEQRKQEALEHIQKANSIEELDAAEMELRKVNIEIENLKSQMENTDLPPESRKTELPQNTNTLQTIATFQTANRSAENEEDIYNTIEYRKAFQNYVLKGEPIPEKFNEKRAAVLTTVSDIGAVIPTTIQNKVIEDMTIEGKILSRINQTSYQGGLEIPISDINITATWLASENEVSEEQKAEMNAKLTFRYHVLEARVAIGLLSTTVALPLFEATVVNQLKKAMTRALETAIVEGSGNGQPLGFTKYTLPENQVITMTESDIGTVKKWAEVEGEIPEAYEDSVIYVMAKKTWEMYLNSMTDTTGQKIGLGRINEKGQKILNGREVLTVDKFPSFISAKEGAIFGAVVDLSQYCLNSNLAMYYKKYFDEDKNKWIHKALTIADGKMTIGTIEKGNSTKLVGAKGLLYLKKGTTQI